MDPEAPTTPEATPPTPEPVPSGLRTASTLCWTMAVLDAGGAAALAVHAWRQGGVPPPVRLAVGLSFLLALPYGAAGLLIRKRRRSGAWIGLVVAALTVLGYSAVELPKAILGVVLNTGIIALLATNWRHFRD